MTAETGAPLHAALVAQVESTAAQLMSAIRSEATRSLSPAFDALTRSGVPIRSGVATRSGVPIMESLFPAMTKALRSPAYEAGMEWFRSRVRIIRKALRSRIAARQVEGQARRILLRRSLPDILAAQCEAADARAAVVGAQVSALDHDPPPTLALVVITGSLDRNAPPAAPLTCTPSGHAWALGLAA